MRWMAVVVTALCMALGLSPLIANAAPTDETIIGGTRATHAPWAAALLRNDQLWCSGSIIAPTWMLTAKHCFTDNNPRSVRVGLDAQAGPLISISGVAKHPNEDLALVRLAKPVNTSYAQLGDYSPRGGAEQVFGFGKTQTGQTSRYLKVAAMFISVVTPTRIHAVIGNGVTGGGDSGGPVFQGGKQIAVHVSGNALTLSTHVRLQPYRGWIRSITGV